MSEKASSLRVLMLGAFDPEYPRHFILRTGLEAAGVEVIVRHLPKTASTIQRFRLALHSISDIRCCDAMLIPAFNQALAPFVWLITRFTRTPMILDYMVGLTDVNRDRATVRGIKAWLFRQIDRFNTRRLVTLTDTAAHREIFRRLLGGRLDKMHVVPVGVKPEWLTLPPPPVDEKPIIAQFIGTYIPFQGVDVIIRAAHLLRDDARVRFELIGGGQTYAECVRLAEQLGVENVDFVTGFFPFSQIAARAAKSTISLGVFGEVEKTAYVVPNKVYDGLAMGHVVITADSPALREFFTPDQHLITVPAGNAEALAAAIQRLLNSPEQIIALGAAGRMQIERQFMPETIGSILRQIIELQGSFA